jgi:cellulose synthase/poly-beta-1,6-N-acetylglucosamine synthase-like glycosyltransferase
VTLLIRYAVRFASAAGVLVFSVRRLVLLLASYRTPPSPSEASALPSLAIVVACRDEVDALNGLLPALEDTDYPHELLSIVLVDDGSSDGTGEALSRWAAQEPSRHYVSLPRPVGKVPALAAGLAAVPSSALVAVCDADQRPRSDCWRRLARAFSDERVGAAAGFLAPANHDANVLSRYAALEAWVHQLVTSKGKEALRLNPPTLGGGSVYRRAALDDVGGFAAGISGEDVTTTVALTEAGWTTRFLSEAIVENKVVEGWDHYWHQHMRWARGVLDTTSEHRRDSRATLWRRIEAWLVSAGYLDRLCFLAASILSSGRVRRLWLPGLYGSVAVVEVWVALLRGGVPLRHRPKYLSALVLVFPVDVAATVVATLSHLRRRPHDWRSPR